MLAAVAAAAVPLVLFGGIARAAAPTATTWSCDRDRRHNGDGHRHRRSRRAGDELVRPVRHVDVVRRADREGERGSGTTAVNITSNLASLKAGSTYHYRVVATNTAGTVHGGDAVFTMLTPPGAATGAATGISTTTATLNGTVDPNSRDTTFYFASPLTFAGLAGMGISCSRARER